MRDCGFASVQGTLTLLAALAGDAREVAPLLARVVLLCPVAYLGHMASPFLRVFSRLYLDTVSHRMLPLEYAHCCTERCQQYDASHLRMYTVRLC